MLLAAAALVIVRDSLWQYEYKITFLFFRFSANTTCRLDEKQQAARW